MFKTGSLSSRHYTLTIILLKYSCKLHSLHRYIVVYANLPVRLAVDYAPEQLVTLQLMLKPWGSMRQLLASCIGAATGLANTSSDKADLANRC